MRSEQALKICALHYLCSSRSAAGEQPIHVTATAFVYVPLCREHKELYDFLGEEHFKERFGIWLFPKAVKARQ